MFSSHTEKIGLIAGRGDLPALLIQAAHSQQREIFVLAIKGDTNPLHLTAIPHQWIEIAEIAQTLEIFRAQGVTEVIMAGGLSRPPISAFKPSLLTAKLLGRIGKAFFAGDDALFKAIVQIFDEEGFRILGAEELLHDLLTPAGFLTTAHPSPQAQEDIRTGIRLMQEIGKLDIGQALVIRNGQVLGVEALEGTDALIARSGAMLTEQDEARSGGESEARGAKSPSYQGILVKSRKPNQEKRVDLPSIGIETIRNLHQAGFAGVAIEAGGSLFIRRTEALMLANELGLFVQGFDTP